MKRKHGLSLFIASCIPGCGQMHQGYMKRGASLLTAFCGLFVLAVFLEIGALAVLMLPLWLYSFFDSYNLRSQTDEEAAANPDAYLFGLSDMDSQKMAVLLRRRHSVIGWGLIALGVYVLWQRVGNWLYDVFSLYDKYFPIYHLLRYDIPRLAVSLGIIALGIWFIRSPRHKASEDIPAFVPPVEPEPKTAEAREEEAPHGDD
ncbi:hypothetical protein [uncultured Dysosmobacter sp.]|uniref:hypothetical protein n=1 Tax=uncultured Dysosmobacter sp. TaxID=2591384 RepID=UPI002607C878|nr:hypothetical protein [uncultured Dysosmobacter sp.]